jgi:lipoprotein-anchoring transpeptidase ErfK/SrfK
MALPYDPPSLGIPSWCRWSDRSAIYFARVSSAAEISVRLASQCSSVSTTAGHRLCNGFQTNRPSIAHEVYPPCNTKAEKRSSAQLALAGRREFWLLECKLVSVPEPPADKNGKQQRVMMKLGWVGRFAVAALLAVGTAGCTQADRFSSAPTWNFIGGATSPIPRTTVSYAGRERPGTIIINTSERRLYLVLGNEQALRYGIGVGRVGFTWAGVTRVSAKKEWPDWTPPPQMLRRRPDLPRFMNGGLDNPLGARAMYLGSTLFRIHGSNEPETIGQAVSSGCFRLTNEDVIDLYSRVPIGAKVIVMR